MKKFMVLIPMFLCACTVPIETKPVIKETPVPFVEKSYKAAWDAKADHAKWTQYTAEALDKYGADMLKASPKDVEKYCDKLKGHEKEFYIYLISAMAERESGFKPETEFKESFNDSKGKPVISTGMLQISIESGKSYGCNFKVQADLKDAQKNLECGVKILNRWIGRDQLIGTGKLGGARYWSVMRDTSGSQGKIKAKTLAFCKELK